MKYTTRFLTVALGIISAVAAMGAHAGENKESLLDQKLTYRAKLTKKETTHVGLAMIEGVASVVTLGRSELRYGFEETKIKYGTPGLNGTLIPFTKNETKVLTLKNNLKRGAGLTISILLGADAFARMNLTLQGKDPGALPLLSFTKDLYARIDDSLQKVIAPKTAETTRDLAEEKVALAPR